jgi:tRNA-specific 2-thiouridylase
MSGGVDSSVAAALLLERGHDVVGVTMKLWGGDSDTGCCSVSDVDDARRVAQQLGIDHHVFSFGDEFDEHVVAPYVAAHASGRTPNPCIECNRHLKFSKLLRRAGALGFDAVATGHHARVIERPDGVRRVGRGADAKKDQSYVLYMLDQAELSWTHFPVGEYSKPEIREIAASLGLRTAHKPESQEICFVPGGKLHPFLEEAVPEGSRPGPILTADGSRIGTHRGFAHYTVGQRRGLGVGVGLPLYVREVRPADNAVVVAPAEEQRIRELDLSGVSFVGADSPEVLRAAVMTRYRGPEAAGTLERRGGSWTYRFDEPQPPAAPGQAAVFYCGEEVLGGGTIDRVR